MSERESAYSEGWPREYRVHPILGPTHSVVLFSDAERIRAERDEHLAKAVRLAAENLRYRIALEEIADSEFGPAATSIARAALDPGKVK